MALLILPASRSGSFAPSEGMFAYVIGMLGDPSNRVARWQARQLAMYAHSARRHGLPDPRGMVAIDESEVARYASECGEGYRPPVEPSDPLAGRLDACHRTLRLLCARLGGPV